ncbi:NPC intracellular cholesterol transporter 2 [Eumeta japonica]|uniref:NPC intracellular cholesterol transporter 2 n=1 Tax=Eumeta variegata TaxID=151549 RepID=A0A4C1UEE1_EUMVA|nr:NPC intracellular cholesterol transporter 2 [Eumeta japonica]
MSIPHTLAPVRVGSVGLKPTKKVPLKLRPICMKPSISQRTTRAIVYLEGVRIAVQIHHPFRGSIEGLKDKVQLTPCKRLPCRLKKGTTQHISITFTPGPDLPYGFLGFSPGPCGLKGPPAKSKKDLEDLKTHVTADVFGVPLPFLGVDGNSVCDKILTEAGEKAACPLKAGTQYVYKDSFPILAIYPNLDVKVHWALQDGAKDVTCFEVPARIA